MALWYQTGTAAVTSASLNVTGSGTAWLTNAKVGDGFTTDYNKFHVITAVADDEHLTIFPAYSGSTDALATYAIIPLAVTDSSLAGRLADLLYRWHNRETEFTNWLAGTVSGGPNSDGKYPLTDVEGNTTLVECPAWIVAIIGDPAITTAQEIIDGLQGAYDLVEPLSDEITALAAISANITTVAGVAANITTAAGIAAYITTVAGIAANVTTVAGIAANVTAVAGNAANISTVAGAIAAVGTVSTSIADVNTIATNIADVSAVAANEANIDTVAGVSANVTTVATAIADVGTVATNIADVSAVAANETNIDTVATNTTNINLVAAVDAEISAVAAIDTEVAVVAGIDTEVAVVAGIAANVTTAAGAAANIGTVATNVASVNTVAGAVADVNTVAGVAADVTAVAAVAGDVTSAATNAAEAKDAVSAVAFRFLFDSSTTMADPGTGDVRFSHGTLSSVTSISISALTADAGNPDISSFIASWDESTHTPRGVLTLRKKGAAGVFAQYGVTGTVTDSGAWLQFSVTYIAHAGSFSNGDTLFANFVLSGNDGSGTGDMEAANNLSDVADIPTARATLLGVTPSSFALALLEDADAETMRTTLGVDLAVPKVNFASYHFATL